MLEGCELLPQSQSQADTHAWCQDLSINAAESVYLSGKIRSNLVRRARLVTYVSLTVTLVGGFSGIAAALALDRCSHHSRFLAHLDSYSCFVSSTRRFLPIIVMSSSPYVDLISGPAASYAQPSVALNNPELNDTLQCCGARICPGKLCGCLEQHPGPLEVLGRWQQRGSCGHDAAGEVRQLWHQPLGEHLYDEIPGCLCGQGGFQAHQGPGGTKEASMPAMLAASRACSRHDCCGLWCSFWGSASLWARRPSGTSGPERALRRAACCSCWRLPLSWCSVPSAA